MEGLHGCTFPGAFSELQYHKFAAAASPYRAARRQLGGGVSPLNGMGVAPVTLPIVALSLT